jgi:hypothetical protein
MTDTTPRPKFAIRDTWPSGRRLGDGLLTAGVVQPPRVRVYDTRTEADAVAVSLRANPRNAGHQFEVLPYEGAIVRAES